MTQKGIKIIISLMVLLMAQPAVAEDIDNFNFSIVKPLVGKHYKERNHSRGLEYNENYLASGGIEILHDTGFGVNAVYVDDNSLGHQSWYLHAGYMYEINEQWSVGGWLGVRNGYPKKAEGRDKSDFIPSGMAQVDYCFHKHVCSLNWIAPNVAVTGIKIRF